VVFFLGLLIGNWDYGESKVYHGIVKACHLCVEENIEVIIFLIFEECGGFILAVEK
jgi:hypothetical protein